MKKYTLFIIGLLLLLGITGSAQTQHSGLYPVKVMGKSIRGKYSGDKWGFINEKGQIVIKPQFDEVGYSALAHFGEDTFSEGFAPVKLNGKFGYIDKTGRIVILPRFDFVGKFSEGLAGVKIGDKVGFIDSKGKVVIGYRFSSGGPFSEGLAGVTNIGGMAGYINHAGKFVIRPAYYLAYDFSEGIAKVEIGDRSESKTGYIDKSGKYIVEPTLILGEDFAEGFAKVGIPASNSGSSFWPALIDKTGKVVMKQYYEVDRFSEGLAPATRCRDCKYGYIDSTGNFVIPPQFDYAGMFSNGLARIGIEQYPAGSNYTEKKYGYIDKTGAVVIAATFERGGGGFSGNLAHAAIQGKGDCYINKSGKIVWSTY